MMRNKFKSLICITSFALSPLSFAQVVNLNEAKVIEMALKRNEAMGISQAEIEIANSKIDAATSSLLPTLSIQAQVQKSSGRGNAAPNAYDWNERATIGVSQPIYTFGKISSAIDIAKVSQKISKSQALATKADIVNTARKLYYRVLFSSDILRVSKESFENANQNKKTLEKRVAYGRISRNDNLKMQADVASRKPLLIDSEKNLNIAKFDLMNFINIPESSELNLEVNSLRKVSLSEDDGLSTVENNIDIKILTENLKLSELAVDNERSNRMPTLSAFANFTPSNYKDGFLGDKIKDQKDLTFGVMFTFEWPFGGSLNDAVQIKKTQSRIAKLQLDMETRNQRVKLLKLYRQKESLERKLESELRAIELALSSYKVSLGAFATGGVSQLQLNDSELLLTNNKINYAGTKLELLNTMVDIQRIKTESSKRGE
ncbi:putative outer membrane efflux protein [Halobacteriovorax marinus SJ]|uniref:Outer membrane efflux protein n=1 Tax=Halobacteriovorax marinus (strain ATCC BAA-682 / DSM 15412 / SJ) TaxID=862908 RepID=E1WY59_HALMS|nr:TolC family protein [Halobacteriovorax marinus]CBW27614.1 putative outer membrane efflux protein [Halobacteriovorax marinus SJ]